MSDSKLATYSRISPNRTSPRNHAIDTITIHCMAGQMSAKACADMFYNNNQRDTSKASSNYCIGYDGAIALSVPEADRSWCSSSGSNDHRAITIEVASDSKAPYAVTNAAYNALLNLVTDICKRNNIKELKWVGDNKEYAGKPEIQNLTLHKWFANKACPGAYLIGKMPEIAKTVNARITSKAATTTKVIYRIRRSWADAASQVGAYNNYTNAKLCCDKNPGFSIYDNNGKALYTAPKKSDTEIAKEVIQGKWSNGATRKAKLEAAGYNYNTIQQLVNQLLKG